MSQSNFIPVTHQQATESKISNSVKISKQLMKSELEKRKISIKKQYDKARDDARALDLAFITKLKKEVEHQVRLALNNDSEITRFRNLFTKFSRYNGTDEDFPKFTTNISLFKDFDLAGITNHLFLREEISDKREEYTQFLLGSAAVNVNLQIPDVYNSEYDSSDSEYAASLGYSQPIYISNDIINDYFTCNDAKKECRALSDQYDAIDLKLKNIDSVAEEMEAQLLVQELSQSEEGKRALEIVGNLVGEMLGDKPALLNFNKD